MLMWPTLASYTFIWCVEEWEDAMSMCKVSISSLSLPRIGHCVKINFGLCLSCALSFGRHLCCSKKFMQIIKANLPSVWGPPHHTASLGNIKGQKEKGGVGPGVGTPRGKSVSQPGHVWLSCTHILLPPAKTPAEPRMHFYYLVGEFSGRNTSHKRCFLEFKLISFCCATISLIQRRLQYREKRKMNVEGG